MARIVILGAGISGHTAALVARRLLSSKHSVVVVNPSSSYNWIPSNIWVGVGRMAPEDVVIDLKPVYATMGIDFVQGRAMVLRPEGTAGERVPSVEVERTDETHRGKVMSVPYDYLINATGPKLRFDKTPGLGPDGGHTLSVCTHDHAAHAADELSKAIERMKAGERLTFVVGTGHGTCTCEGAAFEYVFNIEHEFKRQGVREQARIVYLTNEAELGDFGVNGMVLKSQGFLTPSRVFAESLYAERGIEFILGAHVQRIELDTIHYENLEGVEGQLGFDFAMLLPPFTGVGLTARNALDEDITEQVFMPNGFMKVDADYTQRPYEEWSSRDWPRTYQNPTYSNLFAVGIAFAPPHAISKPRANPRGTPITPAPPRTGMPSASMARAVAESVADMVKGRSDQPTRHASMAEMGAACVASAGHGLIGGNAAAMTMYPIVPDFERFPLGGRDTNLTFGEIGTAGHWIKHILHHMFLYKAKARPLWWLIPE